MLKAILFDLDDTLIDWGEFFENWEEIEAPHVRGVHGYLTNVVGHAGLEFEAYRVEYTRRTRAAWANARTSLKAPHVGRILLETAVALGVPENLLDVKLALEHYNWQTIPGTVVFPDVIEALDLLRERGLKFGIVTNAYQPMELRDVEIDGHGLLDYFPTCRFSAADVGFLKPHPSIFERALDCLGTEPEETVFIGDNMTADIAGAQAAGMRAILRNIPRRKALLSGIVVPDATIDALTELPAIFDEWFPGWGKSKSNGASPA